jgi:ribonuclease HII
MTPDYVLLDGTVWDNVGKYKIELVTKGDDTYPIAAAAIVAKVRRDEYMLLRQNCYELASTEGRHENATKTPTTSLSRQGMVC